MSEARYPEWAEFCAQHDLSQINRPTAKDYLAGDSRPTVPAIAKLAALLGVTEREIIGAAGHGQAETLNELKRDKHARFWDKYKKSDQYDWHLKNQKTRRRKTRREKLLHRASLGLISSRPVLVRLGLAPSIRTPERLKEQRIKQREKAKQRGYKNPNDEKRRLPFWDRIAREIKTCKNKLDKCDMALSREWEPWHSDGCVDMKTWKIKNRDAYLQYMRPVWKVRTYKKKARVDGLGPVFTINEWHSCMKGLGYMCSYCGIDRKSALRIGHDLEADHIIPTTYIPAPLWINQIANIIPACKSCNSSKRDRLPFEWKGYVAGRNQLADQRINAIIRRLDDDTKITTT